MKRITIVLLGILFSVVGFAESQSNDPFSSNDTVSLVKTCIISRTDGTAKYKVDIISLQRGSNPFGRSLIGDVYAAISGEAGGFGTYKLVDVSFGGGPAVAVGESLYAGPFFTLQLGPGNVAQFTASYGTSSGLPHEENLSNTNATFVCQ